ncbi:MAG: DMT family transporter [Myxococcota bacterium]
MSATALAYGLAFLSALAWAALDAVRKRLAGGFPQDWTGPVALVIWLTLGQSPLFALWWWTEGAAAPEAAYWLPGGLGLALQIGANLLFVRALQVSPLSLTIPFLGFTPAFAILAAAALLGELPTPLQLAGTVLVVAGATVLHAGGLLAGLRAEPGSAMMLGVAALWAISSNLDRYVSPLAPPSVHALVQNGGVGLALLLMLGVLRRGGPALAAGASRLPLLLAAFALAALAFGAQLLAVKTLIVPVVETLKRSLGLVSAVLLGRLAFGEPLGPRKLGGVALMIVGAALLL